MANRAKKPADISQEDWESVDVPEATDAEFATARPFKEMFPIAIRILEKNGPASGRGAKDPYRVPAGSRRRPLDPRHRPRLQRARREGAARRLGEGRSVDAAGRLQWLAIASASISAAPLPTSSCSARTASATPRRCRRRSTIMRARSSTGWRRCSREIGADAAGSSSCCTARRSRRTRSSSTRARGPG